MDTTETHVLMSDGQVIAVLKENRFDLIEEAVKQDIWSRLDGNVNDTPKIDTNYDCITAVYVSEDAVFEQSYEIQAATLYS